MARTVVPTFTASVLTAAQMNTYVRDNVNALLSPPRAYIYRTTLQTIPSVTWTKLALDSSLFSSGVTLDGTGRITITESGLYSIEAQATFTSTAVAGTAADMRVCVGPAATIQNNYVDSDARFELPATEIMVGRIATMNQLTVGQWLEMYVYHDSAGAGAARDIIVDGTATPVVGPSSPRLVICKLAELA